MATSTSSTSAVAGSTYVPTTSATATTTAKADDTAGSQDRFLKLLVAQLNNQDPMNPMDNAQMTSQIAQINTVTGIQQLNSTVTSLAGQFASMQLMQGNSMVGHEVLTEGSTLSRNAETGVATGAFDLDANAGSVNVQVLSANGTVIDTVSLGTQDKGCHNFEWDASKYTGSGDLTFKVVAANGTDKVNATTLVKNKVVSVSAENNALMLQLSSGASVAYSSVKAVM